MPELTRIAVLIALLCSIAAFASWRVYSRQFRSADPFDVLVKQAVKFRWKQTAEVRADGFGAPWTQRSVRFARGKEEAVIWYKSMTITLIRVHASPEFDNFVDLDKWIMANPRDASEDLVIGERLYLRKIDAFIIRHGHHFDYVANTALDEALFTAVTRLHHAGYTAEEDAEIVAALTLDGLGRYDKNRDAALRFLASMEKTFSRQQV